MTRVHQRSVALTWTVPVSTLLLVAVAVLLVPQVPGRTSLGRVVLLLPALLFFLFGGTQPLFWWWRADLRIDSDGVRFGAARTRPAQVTFVARNPWVVPWEAASDVRLVRSSRAIRAMRRAARPGAPPQPTCWGGYFPAWGRAALVLDVDLARVRVPQIKPPSTRRRPGGPAPGVAVATTSTWAFPVRNPDAVLECLRDQGVVVVEIDAPVLPYDGGLPAT